MFNVGPSYFADRDPFFSSVLLLLRGEGVNGGTSILDSSGAARTCTPTGVTTSNTVVKDGATSLKFVNASASKIAISPGAPFAFGTGDFCVESWVYATSVTSKAIFDLGGINGAGSFGIFFEGGNLTARIDGTGNDLNAAFSTLNSWKHIAVCRAVGTMRIFIDGAVAATGARAQNITNSAPTVSELAGFGYNFDGYMDNYRVTKAGRYTAAFTPLTSFPGA